MYMPLVASGRGDPDVETSGGFRVLPERYGATGARFGLRSMSSTNIGRRSYTDLSC